jgi:hypothetical protein
MNDRKEPPVEVQNYAPRRERIPAAALLPEAGKAQAVNGLKAAMANVDLAEGDKDWSLRGPAPQGLGPEFGTVHKSTADQMATLDLGNVAQQLTSVRGKTHGEFRDHAKFTMILKDAMRNFQREDGTTPWDELTDIMKESLDMNSHKIGRIFAGRADFKDHWADMAGYSQLVADRLVE